MEKTRTYGFLANLNKNLNELPMRILGFVCFLKLKGRK